MHGRSTTNVKNSKRAILTKIPCLGRKKRAFSKRPKKGEEKGEHLWERAKRQVLLPEVRNEKCGPEVRSVDTTLPRYFLRLVFYRERF